MLDTIRVPEASSLAPKILVFGVGGGGCNAVSKMQKEGLCGVEFVVANTDVQSLEQSGIARQVQLGIKTTRGLGAGANPEIGKESAAEARAEISEQLEGAHMCFVTAGMGGGTGTGAAPVVAELAREMGVLTVGVVTKPFHFEGDNRIRIADVGVEELRSRVHTLVVLPNQNLFKVTNDSTPIGEIFQRANQVLYRGIKSITDLMVKPGLINLDFADVKAILSMEGTAIMGTGEAEGEKRARVAATDAMDNQLLEDVRLADAKGILINVIGGNDMTLLDLQDATETIRENINDDAKIIVGSVLDPDYDNVVKVTLIATGLGSSEESEGFPALDRETDSIPENVPDATEPPSDDYEPLFADPDPDSRFEPESWPQDYEDGRPRAAPLAAESTLGDIALEHGNQADNHDSGAARRHQYVVPRASFPISASQGSEPSRSDAAFGTAAVGRNSESERQPERMSLRSMFGRRKAGDPSGPENHPHSEPRLTAERAADPFRHEEEDQRHIPAFIRRQAN